MNRHITAFLLAPLIVPLLMSVLALQILREVPFLYWLGLLIAPVASCAGAILVGAPLACPPDRLDGRCDHRDSSRRNLSTGAGERHPNFGRADFRRSSTLGRGIIAKPSSMESLIGPAILGAVV